MSTYAKTTDSWRCDECATEMAFPLFCDGCGMHYPERKRLSAFALLGVPVRFEFTERPAPTFDVFRKSTAYHKPDCPVRCPLYKGTYDPRKAELPVAADILKRVVMMGCVEVPLSQARGSAAALKRVIRKMEA